MQGWRLVILGAGFGLLAAGSAAAGLGSARWNYYSSDLIRCEDAANLGVNACGTDGVGDDPLRSGRVTMSGKNIIVQLNRADPEELYFVDFVPLRNTGADSDGSYEAEERIFIGGIFTNRGGNATLRTQNMDVMGPQLGYFVLSTADFEEMPIVTSLSAEAVADIRTQQFENEERQFVTGFDPEAVPRPEIAQ